MFYMNPEINVKANDFIFYTHLSKVMYNAADKYIYLCGTDWKRYLVPLDICEANMLQLRDKNKLTICEVNII